MEHPIPYNGTVFTLHGVAQLDSSVDTNVTVTSIWSDSDGAQVTTSITSPPYTTSLEFRPLASGSSKEYSLNVTIRPTGDSFVVGNSTSIVYRLTVQRKFVESSATTSLSSLICSTSKTYPYYHCGITPALIK